jgi:ketosteroid isomerase-like protein
MTTINDLDDFKALEPFFRIVEQGLDGLADGGHFFDLLAADVVFDFIITTPGYPRHVEGRQAVAELYRPYGDMIVLDRSHDLAVHHDPNTGVVVLEYASQGRVVPTGASYANRYISVLTIADRKVTRWRDYLDPVAVFDALGWPSPVGDLSAGSTACPFAVITTSMLPRVAFEYGQTSCAALTSSTAATPSSIDGSVTARVTASA